MGNEFAIQIKNLTKIIGKKTIVDNLSMDIPKGEVFGFLGPNGAGKTTTIRMIVGLISKNQGQVLVNGVDIDKNFYEAMNHIGVIVENPEMYKYLTGYQNLLHFAKMSPGVTKERITEVTKQVGLENRIHEKVKTYSLGMRQRLGLAQALLRKPNVLILDEPTNGLDPAGIRELRDHLRTLAKNDGTAVIVSSHLLTEMELMCDRVAIIQAGKLISIKPIQEMMAGEAVTQLTGIEVADVQAALTALRNQQLHADVSQNGMEIEVAIDHDQIPEMIHQLVTNGIKIYSVHPVTRTLEETFLEMTGGGQLV